MVGDHTFHLHNWSLVVSLFIIQSCINMWHAPSHIIDYGRLLDVVDPPTVMLHIWAFSQQMFFSTTLTFQGFFLWVISLTWGRSKGFISTLRGEILLVYTFSRKNHLRTLPIVLKYWGFKPLFLESWTTFFLPVLVWLCLVLELLIAIPCLPNSVF